MVDAHAFFAPAEISQEWTLPTTHLGQHVVVFSRIDSTNSEAMRLTRRPDCSGLALLADEQLAGRGQHGRSWIAPPRASVLLSILLFPPATLIRPVLLTALAAVAVCRLVHERTGHSPRIKWPNDVLVADRKICGILIEQARHGPATTVVLGIGLNVAQSASDFARLGLPLATSLRECGDPNLQRDDVARHLLTLLDREYGHLLVGNLGDLELAWRGFLDLGNSEVVVEASDAIWTGRIGEVHFGGLRLLRPGLDPLWLPPESIRHIERH